MTTLDDIPHEQPRVLLILAKTPSVFCDSFPHSLQAQQVIQDHSHKYLELKEGQRDWSMCLGTLQVGPPHLWNKDNSSLSPSAGNDTKFWTPHAQFEKIWCQYIQALLQPGRQS